MKKTIWKFPLNVTGLWALVDPHAPTAAPRVSTFGIGHPCDADVSSYVGTYQTGSLVFHVFASEVA